jgi:7-cyano-7-deazaguanine synthase
VAQSALTADVAIEMTERGLPSTFVPGRNLVFLIYAAALADRRGLGALVGGMCETDFSGYPDCRRDTLDAMQAALNLGMDRDFVIETPLMKLTKAQTWALAKTLGGEDLVDLIVVESHTCYQGDRGELHAWGHGCGECPACELRQRGYEEWDAGGRVRCSHDHIQVPLPLEGLGPGVGVTTAAVSTTTVLHPEPLSPPSPTLPPSRGKGELSQ